MQKTLETFLNDGLEPAQREAICDVLRRFPQIQAAQLYGSRATGRYRAGSDIDLTLLGDINLMALNEISMALDDLLLPYKIDLSAWDQIDNEALRRHIERAGKRFYCKK